ncbi:MAG: hypothetical protein ACRDIL_09190 [Candidatus Limnocylindrales bacterium]
MPAIAMALGVLLVILAIPFGLMLAPLALGVILVVVGWRHVAAGLLRPTDGGAA